MKKVLLFMLIGVFALASVALAADKETIKAYMDQVQNLQIELLKEQQIQQDLLQTKDLLLELDRTNKEEWKKLGQDDAAFQSDISNFKADRASLDDEEKRFDSELAGLKAQRDSNAERIRSHNQKHDQHNSWKPNPYDHAAVNAYNAEADQLDANGAALNAEKDRLDAAKDRVVTWGESLDMREKNMEQKRQALIKQGEYLDRKESDLKWAREKGNEQTLKWADDTKKNNARLDEITAQMNALLTKIGQMNSKCANMKGVGTLDLTNLNGASEQAVACLQQMYDGAGQKSTAPVAPKPPFKATKLKQ